MNTQAEPILGWIRENCAQNLGDRPLQADTKLLEQGILDSLQVVQLVNFIEGHFEVEADVEDVVPENFETPAAIVAWFERLRSDT
jgi:D-alanine--poly(phosphoribitol) ligase subunit 2